MSGAIAATTIRAGMALTSFAGFQPPVFLALSLVIKLGSFSF
jgi:hypothetical protein